MVTHQTKNVNMIIIILVWHSLPPDETSTVDFLLTLDTRCVQRSSPQWRPLPRRPRRWRRQQQRVPQRAGLSWRDTKSESTRGCTAAPSAIRSSRTAATSTDTSDLMVRGDLKRVSNYFKWRKMKSIRWATLYILYVIWSMLTFLIEITAFRNDVINGVIYTRWWRMIGWPEDVDHVSNLTGCKSKCFTSLYDAKMISFKSCQ